MFILSSISRDLQFLSVSHTLLYKNSGSEVFGNTTFLWNIYQLAKLFIRYTCKQNSSILLIIVVGI